MSRHQANRRRTYGRRQHELHERPEPSLDWPGEADERSLVDRALADDARPRPLGDLLGHPHWRWVTGRG